MTEIDFVKRMESLGLVGPQMLSAECVLMDVCRQEGGGAICCYDIINEGRSVNTAYIELVICGKIIKEKIPLLPGEGVNGVIELLNDVEYDNEKHSCGVTIFDYCDRAIASTAGDVYLQAKCDPQITPKEEEKKNPDAENKKADDNQSKKTKSKKKKDKLDKTEDDSKEKFESKSIDAKVIIPDSVEVKGNVPVKVCQISLSSNSSEGASALVRISIDGKQKYSTMMWAAKDPTDEEIQVLPEFFSGRVDSSISIDVYNGLQNIFSQTKIVKVVAKDKPMPAVESNRSQLEVSVELDQSDYIVDVHDSERLDSAGCIKVAKLEFYSKEKETNIVDLDIMVNNRRVQSDRKQIPYGYTPIYIAIPQNDMFKDDPYQMSLCVIVRDLQSKLISEPRRTVKVRSKFDLNLAHKDYLSARFTNPRAPCVDSIIKKINASGISINGYQSDGKNILPQMEAIVNAVCDLNIQYLSDTFTLENKSEYYQRVRSPQKVYEDRSANCIEISILFASLFEMAGLYPIIAFPTGHAIPGIIISSTENYHSGELPRYPPKNIVDRFADYIITVDSEGLGLKSGFKVDILVFEGTLAKRFRGKTELVCDLDYLVKSGTESLVSDVVEKGKKGESIKICNVEDYRSHKVNPVLM